MTESDHGAEVKCDEAGQRLLLGVLGGVLLAFWPVLVWWWRRVGDDSDEPLGVLALVCALGWVWGQRDQVSVARGGLILAGVVMLGVRALAGELPMLLVGLGLVVALVLGLRLWRLPGVTMLLSLALPWVATLQFVAGYPLRVIVAMGAELALRMVGVTVTREGTDLWHQGVAVGVDAPCSGIRMLWFLLFAGAFLAARFRLNWRRTVGLMAVAGALALLANGVRATVLFFPEAGLVAWPHWTHEATGVLLFLPSLATLMFLARKAERRRFAAMPRGSVSKSWLAAFGVLCVMVAGSWLLRAAADAEVPSGDPVTVTWPETFRGMVLEPLPLSVREEHFAAGFPGALARFRCGEGEVIFRRVQRATRMLHPAEDCFKAAGFEMQRLSGQAVAGDGLWQTWRAQRGDEPALIVCEQIRSAEGDLFTDVSAWYWQALRHPEQGPWTAVTWVRWAEPP
jgi:exosortase/archaeosortase family protein